MGLIVRRRVTLDLARRGEQVTVPFSLGDVGAHEVIFTLRDGSEQILLPVGTHAAIAVKNGYGGTGCLDSCVIDHVNNTVTYTPTPEALSEEGNIECTLHVVGEYGEELGSPTFIFAVSEGDNANTETELGKALESNSNWGLIVDAANNALAAAQAKEDAVTAQGLAEDARDAAVTAQGLAEDARDAAVTAQGLAEGARDAAVEAKGEAVAAKNEAGTAKEDALAAAIRAERAAENAEAGVMPDILQELGDRKDAVISQDAITKAIFPFESLNDVEIINDDTLHQLFYPAPNTDIEIWLVSTSQIATFTNKNMFYINPAISSGNGLTITKYNGYFKIEGTPEKEYKLGNAWVYIARHGDKKICPAGHYKFSLGTTLPDGVTCQYATYREDGTYDSFSPASGSGGKEILYDFYLNVILKIPVGQHVNLTIKPQLQRGHHLDEWVAPVRKEYELAGRATTVIPSPGVSGYLFWKRAQLCAIKYKSLLHMEQMLKDLMVELERKVYAITSGNYLYGTASNGAQAHYKVSNKAETANAVVQRDDKMQIPLPTTAPASGTYLAISRKHAEDLLVAELAKIVANAPADFDTLKEIADYIASDKTNAADINNTLSEHTEKLSEIEKGYVPKVAPPSTGAWGAYYTKSDGTTAVIPISNGTSGSTLAMRTPSGALVANEPTEYNHLATKQYVDDHTIALYRHDLEVVIISDSGTFHATLSAYTKSNEAINTVDAFKGLMKKDGKSTKSIPLFGAFKASNESVTHICGMSYLDGAGYALKNVAPETAPITIANYSTFRVTDTVVTL